MSSPPEGPSRTSIVKEFVDHYNDHKPFTHFFNFAFNAILNLTTMNPDWIPIFTKYNITTVDNFFEHMDRHVRWVPCENMTGTNIYDHLCMLHFILNLAELFPLDKSYSQDPIDPQTHAPYLWMSKWLIRYAKDMGEWMNTPESITDEAIKTFYGAKQYHMEDYPKPEGGWKTFNEFFARKIDPAKRPIVPDTEDTIVITSPADCAFDGQWAVDEGGAIHVKGVPWTISQLLGEGVPNHFRDRFAGGIFMHSFLSPADYHRQHAPVSGKILYADVIPGICYLEVVLNLRKKSPSDHVGLEMVRLISPEDKEENIASLKTTLGSFLDKRAGEVSLPGRLPIPKPRAPEAPNNTGYQFLQARALILIDNPDLGLVAVLPVGMTQISSVVLSVKEGETVQKGDEISYFQFGGSDVVMVFQKDAKVTNEQACKRHYKFGTRVATAPRKKRN